MRAGQFCIDVISKANVLISDSRANTEKAQLFFHPDVTSAPKRKSCNQFIRFPILYVRKLDFEITYITPVPKKTRSQILVSSRSLPKTSFDLSISYSTGAQNGQKRSGDDEVFIYQISPDRRGGKAYKLVYIVKAPLNIYWKFQTDFDNDFLEKGNYFQGHNFISQNGNKVITDDKYTNDPEVYFRWQTTVFLEAHRLHLTNRYDDENVK